MRHNRGAELRKKPDLPGQLGECLNTIVLHANHRDVLHAGYQAVVGVENAPAYSMDVYVKLRNALLTQNKDFSMLKAITQNPQAFIEGCNHYLAVHQQDPLPEDVATAFLEAVTEEPQHWFSASETAKGRF